MTLLYVPVVLGAFGGNRLEGEMGGLGAENERRQRAKAEAKAKILAMFGDKTEIANDDVQRMLGVSDATATNYLSELEGEGAIVQIGREGRFVKYRRVNG